MSNGYNQRCKKWFYERHAIKELALIRWYITKILTQTNSINNAVRILSYSPYMIGYNVELKDDIIVVKRCYDNETFLTYDLT
jgi:hypothetical protein